VISVCVLIVNLDNVIIKGRNELSEVMHTCLLTNDYDIKKSSTGAC